MARLYEMPDGSTHEFESDEVATRAYKAWQKQFGKDTSPAKKDEPVPKVEPDLAEKIAAFPVTRFALGASAPIRGALELLPDALGGDWVRENNKQLDRLIERGKEAYPEAVNAAGSVANFGGEALSPMFLKAAKVLGPAKSGKKLLGQGALVGGMAGLTSPTGTTGLERAQQGLEGAVLGGVATPVAAALAKGATNMVAPLFSKSAADRAAARIATKVSGDRAEQVAAALRTAPADETAAQAAAKVKSSEFSALEPLVKGRKASEFDAAADAQELARANLLKTVTPDLAAAEAARDALAQPYYQRAFRSRVNIDQPLVDLLERMPRGVIEAAREMARVDGRNFVLSTSTPNPKISGESMHYIKRALSDIANSADPTKGVGRDAQNAARGVLSDFVNYFERKVPDYALARGLYAQGSAPVNQAKVLQEMTSVLSSPTGGERVAPFLNVLGRGEQALLKKSTGFPRYESGDLQKLLTTSQYDIVEQVANQLRRDADLARRAESGAKSALGSLRATEMQGVRAPSLLDAKFSILNRLLNLVEGLGAEKSERALASMMLPGGGPKLGGLMQAHINNPYGFRSAASRYQGPLIQHAVEPSQPTE
jgi:hypothetical protein